MFTAEINIFFNENITVIKYKGTVLCWAKIAQQLDINKNCEYYYNFLIIQFNKILQTLNLKKCKTNQI